MKKYIIPLTGFLVISSLTFSQVPKPVWSNQIKKDPVLRVSSNGRYLVYSDGTPFFWLGDTAWELFHRLNRTEKWFDPRYGTYFTIHSGDVKSIKTYTPPSSGYGNDWILVVEIREK